MRQPYTRRVFPSFSMKRTYERGPVAVKMPTTKYLTFKGCRGFTHTLLATNNNTLMVIKGNSLFTPFNTAPNAGADVPHWTTEWAAFYDSSKVIRSSIRLTIRNIGIVEGYRIAIFASRSATVLTNTFNWTDICDTPQFKLYPVKFGSAFISNSSGRQTNCFYSKTTKSMFQGTAFPNSLFRSLIGADPTNEFFYHVLIFTADNTAFAAGGTIGVSCDIKINTVLSIRDT